MQAYLQKLAEMLGLTSLPPHLLHHTTHTAITLCIAAVEQQFKWRPRLRAGSDLQLLKERDKVSFKDEAVACVSMLYTQG